MKKIIIDSHSFSFNIGCKVLKLKYKQQPCPVEEIADFWDDIEEASFKDIMSIRNVESRRVAFRYFDIEKFISNSKVKVHDRSVVKKTTTWVNENGELETVEYEDEYILYKIDGTDLFNSNFLLKVQDYYFVQCKDTSTNRKYYIWVDMGSIVDYLKSSEKYVTALDAIAWTIQVPDCKEEISEIIRQGDCILVRYKKLPETYHGFRHLKKSEYLKLLKLES